jgi:hypothetical protein
VPLKNRKFPEALSVYFELSSERSLDIGGRRPTLATGKRVDEGDGRSKNPADRAPSGQGPERLRQDDGTAQQRSHQKEPLGLLLI